MTNLRTPFAPEAGIAEVQARVAYAVIRRAWLKWGIYYDGSYDEFLQLVAQDLPEPYFGFLRSFVFFASVAVSQGEKIGHWRNRVVAACRAGHTWRRAVFPDYKSNRRKQTPPVSNTGGRRAVGAFTQQLDFTRDAPNDNE